MNERLLQFIWLFRYYNANNLLTTEGETVEIIHPGQWNSEQGPDFKDARIKIGSTLWAGEVEVHLKTSDWLKHGHDIDPNYRRIILHVVWHDDISLPPIEGNSVPTLVLMNRVSRLMLDHYNQWMQSQEPLPCSSHAASVSHLVWQQWTDRLLVERLSRKTKEIQAQLIACNQHWEEVFWRTLCRYFGGSTNAESFSQVAASLPSQVLAKHKNQIHQIEALLLGQAGLLHSKFQESYPQLLYKEYQHLQRKYSLRVVNKPPVFLRMRPANFPTIRLAQLAMLVHKSQHLLSTIAEANSVQQVTQLFDITANDYWHYHYKFDQESHYAPKQLGRQMIETLLINAVIPTLFAYGQLQGKPVLSQRATQWLEAMPPEPNRYTRIYAGAGLPVNSAFASQAVIQLRKGYCDPRRCLECAVGSSLLKADTANAGKKRVD